MTVLIIHGIGGHAGIHWQQWLKEQLENQGHKVIMPAMTNPDKPDRATWLREVKQALAAEDPENLVIIGHSLGATTALDYIEQSEQPIYGFVSVSGFANDYGAELNSYFLQEKVMDFSSIVSKVKKSAVIYGDDDPYVTRPALQELAEGLKVEPVLVKSGGHLNTETGFTAFPRLLDLIQERILPQ